MNCEPIYSGLFQNGSRECMCCLDMLSPMDRANSDYSFLLVSINMDAILAAPTIHQKRQALSRMAKGSGLQDAYNTTLGRIRQQGETRSKLGMEVLMWVSHCERPLKPEELGYALGVELGVE